MPKTRAVILSGEAGTGKTSAALALANDFGWGVIEMNASDTRNAEAIRRVATTGALGETFTDEGEYVSAKEGKRKLIILDEADNLFGKEDSGGVLAIAETIKITRQPIILIVNDLYALTKRSSVIKKNSKIIQFLRLERDSVKSILRNIGRMESMRISDDVFDAIAERSGGDLRSAINDLQSIAEGKKELTSDNLKSLGYRDVRKSVFDALSVIFRIADCRKSREAVLSLDESPERLILWVDENLPLEYRNPEDLARGFDALSNADIFLGRVLRSRNYALWPYASDMMTCGVSTARKGAFGGARYRFPLWLTKMARSKGSRRTMNSLVAKIGRHCHTSGATARRDVLPYFAYLYNNDYDFKLRMTLMLRLDEREIAYLLGEKEDSHAVKHLLEDVEKASKKKDKVKEIKDFVEEKAEQRSLRGF